MRKLATSAFAFAAATLLAHYAIPREWLPLFAAAAALTAAAGLFVGLLIMRANSQRPDSRYTETGLIHSRRTDSRQSRTLRGSSAALSPRRPSQTRLRLMIILLSAAAGFMWSWTYTTVFIMPAWQYHNETKTVAAVVRSSPSPTARGYRVDCRIKNADGPDVGARLYYYDETPLEPGDIVEATARFRRADGTEDYDRIDALTSRGAFLAGYVSGGVSVTGAEKKLLSFPQRLSGAVADMAGRLFPAETSAFMKALLVGRRDELNADAAANAALSASGISHVVSVSGMHVAFLMSSLALVVRNKKRFAAVGVPALLLFMAMVGFTPSVTRAGVMQIFLVCAPLFRRERDSITSLSAVLMLLLIINPYSCASASLQLSFAATLGIILFTSPINAGIMDALRGAKILKRKLMKTIAAFVTSTVSTTVGALVFTLPLMSLHFGYVSLISPVTNLLTLWAVSLAFPLGLAACALGFIALPVGAVIAFPVSLLARYILGAARSLAAIPFSVVYSSSAPVMFWLAYIYVMFITLPLLKARARQYIYPACIAIVLLCAILLIPPARHAGSGNSITALDVGQGLGVVLCEGEHTIMVDCGGSISDAGAAAHEFLLNLGRTSIDLLVLTHFHADHANGVESLLSKMNVAAICIPDPEGSYLAEDIIELARKRGTDIIYVTETYSAAVGGTTVMIYPPLGAGDENERGLSVLCLGGVSSLITGDMNASGERALLRYAHIPEIDVLVVGHHGSRFSTSEEMLEAASPGIAIISVGRNSYGHPSGETLDRLARYGVAVFRTDEIGNVTVGG